MIVLPLLAFGLRLHQLATPLMRWDEGWSIAHASLPLPDLLQVAAWEIHPPLFYLLLKPWLAVGRNVFAVRFFSVLASVIVIPLFYRATLALRGQRRLAWLAAALAAVAPALVYYGQVLRMYAVFVPGLLLALWGLLAALKDSARTLSLVALVVGGVGALATFYYAAFPLAAIYLYGLLVGRQSRRRLLLAGGLTALLYLPWVIYASPHILPRLATPLASGRTASLGAWALIQAAWRALVFDFGSSGWGGLAVGGVLIAGFIFPGKGRLAGRQLLLPLLGLTIAAAGGVAGSLFYFFVPRLLMPAVPFFLLLVAWALTRLYRRWWGLPILAGVVLAIAFWPTSSRFVYEKSIEVTGAFDPHEYHNILSERTASNDYVFFNNLAPAGWYEMDRSPQDPEWGPALRWTPIIVPMSEIEPRVERAAATHARLWFVLYQGTSGPGRELKAWLDRTYYPIRTDWGSEAMFLLYAAPEPPWAEVAPTARFGKEGEPALIELEEARYSAQARPGGEVGVALRWRSLQAPLPKLRVVLQVWDEAGTVLAQRDAPPVNWEYPTDHWSAGEGVDDHHGLLLNTPGEGPLHLALSVYETESGTMLQVSGGDFLELGTLTATGAP